MPNSLGRRRITAFTGSTEVDQLKQELADLRTAYVQDMQNISNDMTSLSEKIEPSTAVDTEVVS